MEPAGLEVALVCGVVVGGSVTVKAEDVAGQTADFTDAAPRALPTAGATPCTGVRAALAGGVGEGGGHCQEGVKQA